MTNMRNYLALGVVAAFAATSGLALAQDDLDDLLKDLEEEVTKKPAEASVAEPKAEPAPAAPVAAAEAKPAEPAAEVKEAPAEEAAEEAVVYDTDKPADAE